MIKWSIKLQKEWEEWKGENIKYSLTDCPYCGEKLSADNIGYVEKGKMYYDLKDTKDGVVVEEREFVFDDGENDRYYYCKNCLEMVDDNFMEKVFEGKIKLPK